MPQNYTSEALIEKVRRYENITADGTVYDDQQILDFINDEIELNTLSIIKSVREDYLIFTRDYSFGQNSDLSQIEIPNYTSGLALRDVYCLDNQGNFYNVPKLAPQEAASMNSFNYNSAWVQFAGFYIQGNYLQLFPSTVSQGATFRLTFIRKPNTLILNQDAARIIAINGTLVTVDNPNPNWTAQTLFAFIRQNAPFEFVESTATAKAKYASYTPLSDVPVSDLNGQDLTVAADVAADLTVGDIVCEAGFSPVIQFLPVESYNVIAQGAAVGILHALNDIESERSANARYKMMVERMTTLISPRVQAKAKVMNSLGNGIGSFGRLGMGSRPF